MKKINLVLDCIKGNRAILIAPDKKKVEVPAEELSSKKKGESFVIEIKSEEEAKASQEKLAKAILNEILNNKS